MATYMYLSMDLMVDGDDKTENAGTLRIKHFPRQSAKADHLREWRRDQRVDDVAARS